MYVILTRVRNFEYNFMIPCQNNPKPSQECNDETNSPSVSSQFVFYPSLKLIIISLRCFSDFRGGFTVNIYISFFVVIVFVVN